MEKSQHEYYLNEQVRAIQKELGEIQKKVPSRRTGKPIKNAGMTKDAKRYTKPSWKAQIDVADVG